MSNLLKIIAAFAAGVVVALGGALLYVRTSEMIHPPPIVKPVSANDQLAQTPPPPPVTMPASADQTSTVPAPVVEEKTGNVPVKQPVKKHTATTAPRETLKETRVARPAPARNIPVQIAQNTPAEQNLPSAVTSSPSAGTASSNDGGQFSLPQPPPPSASEQPQAESSAAPSPAPVPARQPHTVTLPAGIAVTVRLGETLSTDRNYSGDTFRATLDSPIIMDGFIIADRGSRVLGRIVSVQKAGHFEGTAGLVLALTEINTTDGQRVAIQTNTNERKGPANGGQNVAKVAGGAALGAIIGAVAGGGKGAAVGAGAGGAAGTGAAMVSHTKACVIPVETQLSFRLATPITLTEKLN